MPALTVRRLAAAPAYGLLGLLAALDLAAGDAVVLIGALSLGPFVSSLRASPRQTARVAVVAAVLAVVLALVEGTAGSIDHVIRVAVVALAGAISVFAAHQREDRDDKSRQLRGVVEVAQEVMLRPPPSRLAHVGMAAYYASASDLARVGGDLYETAFTPWGVRLIIGDVRGKGLGAVRLAATVLAAFRENVWQEDLLVVSRNIDARVSAVATDEEFVTALVVEIPPDASMSVINMGHHPPVRLGTGGAVDELSPSAATPPLGLRPDPRIDTFDFLVGDRLLLFTDGLVEARDSEGRFFPLESVIHVLRATQIEQAIGGLVAALLQHVPGRLGDDVALLLTERLRVGADSEYTHV